MATPPHPAGTVEETAPQTIVTSKKPIHSLVLDTGPLIKNDPSVSALLAQAQELYIVPSVLPEIRDTATRTRVETTLLPFVSVRTPARASVQFVTDFAKRTGDFAVLSRPDIEVLALGYELECERNNGDWRLRNSPGQKGLNGRPKKAEDAANGEKGDLTRTEHASQESETDANILHVSETEPASDVLPLENRMDQLNLGPQDVTSGTSQVEVEAGERSDDRDQHVAPAVEPTAEQDEQDSDSDGWITPSNLQKHRDQDAHGSSTPSQPEEKMLQAAILTSDYAMQNVALRINLNLISPTFSRITFVKNWVLRCHGCFNITRDMEKQFCPRCGQPTLTRTSCSTDQRGRFQVHLKKNFQWNNRGNVYSVPKAVHGSANGRLPRNAGGGKNGWGKDLILAEDQKEYAKAADEQRRQRKKDLMDDDYLPAILSGKRSARGGRIRVGAGRNVNSKKR